MASLVDAVEKPGVEVAVLVEVAVEADDADEAATEEDEDDDDDEEGDFLDAAYWDDFYADDEQFDWYSAPGVVYSACAREMARLRPETARILDVGCGTASHLAALALRGADVTGADFSRRVVELGVEFDESKRVGYVQADARCLPFRDGSFDVLIDKGCLDCFVSRAEGSRMCHEYLRQVSRVLAPQGVLVLCAVSGVDVVTLLHTGKAIRNRDDTIAPPREPLDDWELARTAAAGEGSGGFKVVQIVASRSKHIYRCVKADSPPPMAQGAPADDDDVFDDQTRDVTLEPGFFCGACAYKLHDLLDLANVAVPRNCPGCDAPVRRFAMS
ncbi:S-adenosyl-L-methionine-dependent methyltransferase [Pelagophyceae sp. CCMP2097]|nr:S-adenosyl-L-methionine-dependent methyltransferase [Pelagophyceae sp. CCMP2097]